MICTSSSLLEYSPEGALSSELYRKGDRTLFYHIIIYVLNGISFLFGRGLQLLYLYNFLFIIAKMMEFLSKSVLVGGLLITGTVNTLTKKIQNDSLAKGVTNTSHEFEHAW
jgi:hypothetical protein